MTASPSTRHTAANTPALARVKKLFNKFVYKTCLDTYNAEGREAARTYIGAMFNAEAREKSLAELFKD